MQRFFVTTTIRQQTIGSLHPSLKPITQQTRRKIDVAVETEQFE